MRILAVDGVGRTAVAAGDGSDLEALNVRSRVERTGRGDADLLASFVQVGLKEAAWGFAELDVICCNIGPGTFTSVRAAVALTKGLALAANKPVLGVTVLQALAVRAWRLGSTGIINVVLDDGRSNWITQMFSGTSAVGEPELRSSPPADLQDQKIAAYPVAECIDAQDILCTAGNLLKSGMMPISGHALRPLYLRAADAHQDAGLSLLVKPALN